MKPPSTVTPSADRRFSVYVSSRANRIVLGVGVVVVLVFVLLPFFGGIPFTRRLVDFFALLAMAQLWNLLLGYGGLISVGQQGYIGIGAYVLWLFSDKLHVHPFIAILFAGVAGAIIALPSAALVFKLKGGYLAIGTWVIAEALRLIVANIKQAGGGSGVTVQAASNLGVGTRVMGSYWWALGAALAAIVVTYLMLRSRTGLALKSIRDNDLAAESSGVNLWRTKLYTFIIAGAGCALVGAIVALHLLRVQPTAAFSINWTAYLIFIVVIGGVGTIEGPIIGTIIYYVLRETTAKYGEWYFIVLGLVAIVVTVWSPRGIYGYIAQKTDFYLFPLQRKLAFGDGDGDGAGAGATGPSVPGGGWRRGWPRKIGGTADSEGSGGGAGLEAAVEDAAAG